MAYLYNHCGDLGLSTSYHFKGIMVNIYSGCHQPVRVPISFQPYRATVQLTLYFTAVIITAVYQFYTIIICYYNVRSAMRHRLQMELKSVATAKL